MNGPSLHARPFLGRMFWFFFPFSRRLWFGMKASRSLGWSEAFVRLSFRTASTSQNSVCEPSSSNTFAKEKTRPSTGTLGTEWPVHLWKMAAGTVYGRTLLEKIDIWILMCDAGKTEMEKEKIIISSPSSSISIRGVVFLWILVARRTIWRGSGGPHVKSTHYMSLHVFWFL